MNNEELDEASIARRNVVRLFLAGVTPRRINFPNCVLDESSQIVLLKETVLRAENGKYPLSRKYQLAFLKELIQLVQARSGNVADELYEILAAFINEGDEQQSFYRIYLLHNGSVIRVRENAVTLSQGSTGLSHWQATYYFSHFVEENRELFCNKSIVEVGSGLGLFGLGVIQLARPSSYVFTDYNPSVLQMLCENVVATFELEETQAEALLNHAQVEVNGGATRLQLQELDWVYWRPEEGHWCPPDLDVVVASDVAYDPHAVPDLCRVIASLLASTAANRACAYIACTVRNEETVKLLQSELSKANGIARSTRTPSRFLPKLINAP